MLAVIVTFVTTYSLILPAITVSVEQVEEVDGLYLGEDDDGYEIVEDNEEQYEQITPEADTLSADFGTEDILDGELIEDEDQPAETESEIDAAGIELWVETETETETETEIESETETVTETDGETESELTTEAESETEIETETEEETDAETGNTTAINTRSAIDKNILASDGKNYKVTVTYGAEAMIPEGAELKVEEILPGENSYREINGGYKDARSAHKDSYEEYVSRAQDALNSDEKVTFARFFDICIVKDGTEIQPSGEVDVRIELADDLSEDVKAVHFGDEVEVLDAARVHAESLSDAVEFTASGFSVYGIVGTTIEKTFVASDGRSYKISVTYGPEAGVPEGAKLEVSEILPGEESTDDRLEYDEYVAKAEEALGWKEGSASYARLFDIRIVDENGEKVEIKAPVQVKVELEDKNAGDTTANIQIVHFADSAEDGDIVENVEVKNDDTEAAGISLVFLAAGFSVYAITDAPEPYESDIATVSSLEEFYNIEDLANEGFYLSIPGFSSGVYFGGSLNSNGCLVEESELSNSAVWYFEPVTGAEHQYYIFTWLNGQKKYIKQKKTNDNSVELASSGTAFSISDAGGGTFYIKHATQNRWLQHSNGGGGIRLYTDNNNAANSKIRMTYASSAAVPKDPYDLDGTTHGIAYDSESIFCTALMNDAPSAGGSLRGQDMAKLDTEGYSDQLFVPLDSDITEWTFHSIEEDYYYITTEVDGVEKYLAIQAGNVSLKDTPGEDCQIRVRPGKGENSGFYSFSAGGYSLAMTGEEGDRSFIGASGNNQKKWFKFAEKSSLTEDDYLIYTAKKISVSDRNSEEVVLYTRIWNGSKYEFYAVDYDGSLIRCYDDGDVIKWVGNQYETAVWELTDYYNYDEQGNPTGQNGYYDLRNTYSGNYIAPQLDGGKIVSDNATGVNLDGRYYQEEYTKIKTWDETYYSYVGLKVDLENKRVVPCPSSQSDDFYFARIKEPLVHLTEVQTVNNNDYGISMKMIDFNNTIVNKRDSLQTQYFGLDSNKTGLLSSNLENGYPESTTNHTSLRQLFAGDQEVNHLFIQSVYDESGYFEYDSTKNYAYLNGSDFEVYDQLGTVERSGNHNTMRHGQFMPYNSLIDPATGEPWPYSDTYSNTTTVTASQLPQDDPRYGEGLHEIPTSEADYFFGMEMSASFTQTASGLDAWGHDIIFEFSGDDDFWLYVDDELILDLGGVHSAMTGSVNFRTGIVTGRNGQTKTLREIFRSNYLARNPGASTEEVNTYLSRFFEDGETVFRDYSTHRMNVFYMERGAGASNLFMRFNLTAVKPGEVTLSKEVTGSDNIDYDLMEFPYQILYKTQDDSPYDEHSSYRLLTQDENDPAVTYQGSKRPVKFAQSFTPVNGTEEYENVFFLKAGEIASINMPDNVVEYKIVECGVNMNIFKSVEANGTLLSQEGDTGRRDYEVPPSSIEDRPEVDYVNEVDPDSLRNLTVTKKLWDEGGKDGNPLNGYDDDETTFRFRISMSAQGSSELVPAVYKKYYVKDPVGNYCRWDAQQKRFVSLGIQDYPKLAEYIAIHSEEGVVFETSLYGTVSDIPGGFSMEFRGLPVDSSFKAEERDGEIPKGYTRIEYERDQGSFISDEEPNQGTIRPSEDPHVLVHNKRGWGLTIKKIWSDADYMDSHDDIYFAIYINRVLLENSVRKLSSPSSSVYYYFDELAQGADFEDYKIYEVRLTNPQTDDEGNISYDGIEKIEEGGVLNVGGTPKGGTHQDSFSYDVAYTEGEPSGGTEDHRNVREDTVTNTRRGIRLIKKDWNGNVLPGAVFTLKDSDGVPVGAQTYTSDFDGLITIAYVDPGTYMLEETIPPSGFQKPPAWTIVKNADDSVSVTGENGTFEVSKATATEMAEITLKNKGFSLQAIKVDKDMADQSTGDGALEGAVFALYRQIATVSGLVKDQKPYSGYEELSTGTDGIIPRITSALLPGTYYLSEVSPPGGYKSLTGDLVFTITDAGTVEIPTNISTADPSTLIIMNNLPDLGVESWISSAESDGHTTFTIRIPNEKAGVPVTIVKTDQSGSLLEDASFTFEGGTLPDEISCISQKTAVKYGDKTIEEALIYQNPALEVGEYTLTEVSAPDGYYPLEGPVTISVENQGSGINVLAKINGQKSTKARAERIDVNHPEYGWRVTIMNSAGYALPSTGGPGTRIFNILGMMLMVLAGTGMFVMKRKNNHVKLR